jgi:hypothetical protein
MSYEQVTPPFQQLDVFASLVLSKRPRAGNTKMTRFIGIFLLIFSVLVVLVVVPDTTNFFANAAVDREI